MASIDAEIEAHKEQIHMTVGRATDPAEFWGLQQLLSLDAPSLV